MTYFSTIHLIILGFFLIGMTVLSIVTIGNVLRLRNVKMSWKSGKLFGYPIFSTIFLLFSLAMTFLVTVYGEAGWLYPSLAYNMIGVSWFVTSMFVSKRYITDYGIVKNINDPSKTVAWTRITDYVEKKSGNRTMYVFFYPDYVNQESRGHIRLDLMVPSGRRTEFERVIHHKLGRKFRLGSYQSKSIEQLK
ncbi:hypothetical protein QLX67_07250 [Balneolaceae bacterium ANBcel3]|nr:hypothetical protein [Balneolaceae bacterium ANBcel3]